MNHRRIVAVCCSALVVTGALPAATGPGNEPAPAALRIVIGYPGGLAYDRSGRMLLSDTLLARVYCVDSSGSIVWTMRSGVDTGGGGPGDPGPFRPGSIAAGSDGSVFVADTMRDRILRRDATGAIAVVAGDGVAGLSGDGGPAARARLRSPHGLAIDPSGNLYFADTGNGRVRRIDVNGAISSVAGGGRGAAWGDEGPAARCRLAGPTGIAVDARGGLIIADPAASRIRYVDPAGVIHTLAGGGKESPADGVRAVDAALGSPGAVAAAADGSVVFADRASHGTFRIRDGVLRTIGPPAVPARPAAAAPDDPAPPAAPDPGAVAIDPAGRVAVADLTTHQVSILGSGAAVAVAGIGGDPSQRRPADASSVDLGSSASDALRDDSTWFDRVARVVRRLTETPPTRLVRWVVEPKATLVGSRAAWISWQTDSPASAIVEFGEGYRMQRRRRIDTPSAAMQIALGGLEPGQTYRFRVVTGTDPDDPSTCLISDTVTFVTAGEGEPAPPVESGTQPIDPSPTDAPPDSAAPIPATDADTLRAILEAVLRAPDPGETNRSGWIAMILELRRRIGLDG